VDMSAGDQPMNRRGAVQGCVAAGVGQGCLEAAVYDKGGQLVSCSFMDTTIARGRQPAEHFVGPRSRVMPHHPVGVKGLRRGVGAIGSPPALINRRFVDALRRYEAFPASRHAGRPRQLWSYPVRPIEDGCRLTRDPGSRVRVLGNATLRQLDQRQGLGTRNDVRVSPIRAGQTSPICEAAWQ